MITAPHVRKLGVILEPTSLEFENRGVLNPGCVQEGDTVHMFYRALDDEGSSTIGYARLKGPTTVVERWTKPIIAREYPYESVGVEDPRVVKIEDTYYMTYVAHDGVNARTAYATGKNLFKLKKKGIVSAEIPYHEAKEILGESRIKDAYFFFASYYEEGSGKNVLVWHKDFILFPEKIGGKFAMLHRVLPDIQIVFFKKFEELTPNFWRDEFRDFSQSVLIENKHWFESRNIGGGCPPIPTKDGWLVIFHTVEETNQKRVYHAGAVLLDKDDPKKIIGGLHAPLFSPTEPWELTGEVKNVVFPTGTAIFDNTLYIYYGAADSHIAVASVDMNELLREVQNPARAAHKL